MNDFGQGIFLTPQTRPPNRLSPKEAISRFQISGGLVYTDNFTVVDQSIDTRFPQVSFNHDLSTIDRSGESYIYLGYYFRQYGHFILETLPMLKYCIDKDLEEYNKILLPFFVNANNIAFNLDKRRHTDLMRRIIEVISMLKINHEKIYFHVSHANIKSNFIVPPKVVRGNRATIDTSYHKDVIAAIVAQHFDSQTPHKKIFLDRIPNRITSQIASNIKRYCSDIGFEIVNMEKLSLYEQIKLMRETKYMIGFSGSAMHNSMFLNPETWCINLCDFRDFKAPKSYIPNQKLCNRISGCQEVFIDFEYQDYIAENKKDFDQPTEQQELYAINNYRKKIKAFL